MRQKGVANVLSNWTESEGCQLSPTLIFPQIRSIPSNDDKAANPAHLSFWDYRPIAIFQFVQTGESRHARHNVLDLKNNKIDWASQTALRPKRPMSRYPSVGDQQLTC